MVSEGNFAVDWPMHFTPLYPFEVATSALLPVTARLTLSRCSLVTQWLKCLVKREEQKTHGHFFYAEKFATFNIRFARKEQCKVLSRKLGTDSYSSWYFAQLSLLIEGLGLRRIKIPCMQPSCAFPGLGSQYSLTYISFLHRDIPPTGPLYRRDLHSCWVSVFNFESVCSV